MGRKTGSRHAGVFLLELMISILLFSLVGAVCTQVLVKAHELSGQARDLSQAVGVCSNAAEILRAGDSPKEGEKLLKEAFPGIQKNGSTLRTVLEDNSVLEIRTTYINGLYNYEIQYLLERGQVIYSLDLSRFYEEAA